MLAVGSSLRGDDAAGLLAARELDRILKDPQDRTTGQPTVEVFLGETAPENLTGQIKGFQPTHVIILDAVDIGAEPGHIRLIRPDEISSRAMAFTHNASLTLLMDYLRHFLDCEIIVLGIQPQTLEFGKPPSGPVLQAARCMGRIIAAAVNARRSRHGPQCHTAKGRTQRKDLL